MTKQLLIYEKAVPVAFNRHKDWSIKAGRNFKFAADLNAVPLTASEVTAAASEFPVVFAGTDDIMPAVVLGVRGNENLFIDADGNWTGSYVPAFIRRYPFVFAGADTDELLTLCIDESFEGWNQEGRGERLFDADGAQTAYLGGVLEFLQNYQRDFAVTRRFCKLLAELDLLEPMTAQMRVHDRALELQGFQAIKREKLKALGDEKILQLFRMDGLELIYAHLQSMQNFTSMLKRLTPDALDAAA